MPKNCTLHFIRLRCFNNRFVAFASSYQFAMQIARKHALAHFTRTHFIIHNFYSILCLYLFFVIMSRQNYIIEQCTYLIFTFHSHLCFRLIFFHFKTKFLNTTSLMFFIHIKILSLSTLIFFSRLFICIHYSALQELVLSKFISHH